MEKLVPVKSKGWQKRREDKKSLGGGWCGGGVWNNHSLHSVP